MTRSSDVLSTNTIIAMKRMITLMAASLAAITSCALHEMDLPAGGKDGEETVKVQVVPSARGTDGPGTKSAVSAGESAVKDINIFFYRDGLLAASEYITTPSVVTFLLARGVQYNVYAVANVGRLDPVDKEADFRNIRVDVLEEGFVGTLNGGGMPMAWSREGYTPTESLAQLPVSLVRLVSKIRFRIDTEALAGLEVTSVRLCNGAGAVTPFRLNGHGGSKVTSASDVTTGDYAVEQDLMELNEGGDVCFFALENCQGTLLPGNTDPWAKVPENVSVAGLCTYLEVGCEFQGGFALSGSITYRIYLGQDNCSNFDIIRNVDMGVSLCLTNNLDNVSWKIDPDVEFNGSLCSAYVEDGLHGLDEQYVGESSLMGLRINTYLEDFIGEGLPGHSLAVIGPDGKPSPDFELGDISYSGGHYLCTIKCLDATEGDNTLCLVDEDGQIVTEFTLDDGELNGLLPLLAIGDGGRYRPGERVIEPQELPYPTINGDDGHVYLYLTDRDGDNLNCMEDWGQYGFDLSLFSPVETAITPTSSLTSLLNASQSKMLAGYYKAVTNAGDEMGDGPSFVIDLGMTNPGTSSIMNSALSKAYNWVGYHSGANPIVDLLFSTDKAESVSWQADYEIVRPKFFLGSEDTFPSSAGWSLGGQTYIAAYNPSFIDYRCDVFYVGKLRSTLASPVLSNAEPLFFQKGGNSAFSYVPGSRTSIEQPYFCDGNSLILRHTSGTQATIDGLPCRIHVADPSDGIVNMSENLSIPNRYIRSDVGVTTLSGSYLSYDHEDLNGGYVTTDGTTSGNATYSYIWGDDGGYSYRSAGWYTGPDMARSIYANKDTYIASYDGYNGSNLHNIINESPVQFTVSWNTSSNSPTLQMSGNTFGSTFKCYVGMEWKSSCSWGYTSGASRTTTTFTVYDPQVNSTSYTYCYTLSGESASVNLPSKLTVESKFASINKTYWHENCTNGINLKSNRFSELAMPVSVTYYISIFMEGQNSVWIPISTVVKPYTDKITATYYTFYSSTARGTYADTSSMTNPDGSDRGKDSNVSSQASKYSEYNKATATYNVGFEFLNLYRWNRFDF